MEMPAMNGKPRVICKDVARVWGSGGVGCTLLSRQLVLSPGTQPPCG